MKRARRNPEERPLGWDEVVRAATATCELAARHGLPCVVVGGVAMQYYGSQRNTADVDFATSKDTVLPLGQPVCPLTFGGYRYKLPSGMEVDCISRDDDHAELYDEAVRYADETEYGFKVLSPEFLSVIKLAAGRSKDEDDLVYLLRVPGLVDRAKARRIAKRYLGLFGAESFDSMAMEADVREARDRGKQDVVDRGDRRRPPQ